MHLDRAKRAKKALWAKRIHSCFCFSESSKAITKKQPLRPSETRSKCHERSECHRAVFHSQIPFYTFKKLLKAFRHPPNADEYRLVEFKKLQTPSINLQTPSKTHFKNYKRQVLKLQTPSINLLDYVCRLIYKFYIV